MAPRVKRLLAGFILSLSLLSLGFDLRNSSVPAEEIQEGGVPVDGVPAINQPSWVSREEADDFLDPEDEVVGLVIGRTIRAYPFRILNWHQVVNDSAEGKSFVVTYCPLTHTARVFESPGPKERKGQKDPIQFGVSGKLHKSNLLLYDRPTKSLWSQIRGEALTGEMKGTFLKTIPVFVTSWRTWRSRYPEIQVLSLDTGFLRSYARNPYADYERSPSIAFSVGVIRPELPAKTEVAGVLMEGKAKAYPLETLRNSSPSFQDRIAGKRVKIERVEGLDDFRIADMEGNPLPTLRTYWFAWQAFYPETEVYSEA